MFMTKHAYARFKQRQKVKNEAEMMRKFRLAVERGILLAGEFNQSETLCYLFDGFKYIVSKDKQTLITLFSAKKPMKNKKHRLVDELYLGRRSAENKNDYNLN